MCHKLLNYDYIIPSDVHLKHAIALVYGDSLTSGAANGVSREKAKVVKTWEQDCDSLRSEKGADVPEIGSYVLSSETPE